MKKTLLYTVVAVTLVAGGVGVSHFANAKELTIPGKAVTNNGELRPMHFLMDILDLDVTPDQKTAIRSILQKHWEEAKPLLQKLNASRVEIRDIIRKTPYDEERIRGSVYKRAEVVADLAVLRGKVSAEVRSVLTPEQQKKVKVIFDRVDHAFASLPTRIENRLNEE